MLCRVCGTLQDTVDDSANDVDTSRSARIVDAKRRRAAIERLRAAQSALPTWSELADPGADPGAAAAASRASIRTSRTPRICGACTGSTTRSRTRRVAVPGHVVLPEALTGVKAPIVVLLGRRFPMIGAHKVLAAYACLVPRLVTGRFDPAHDRAVWPSTGNYCRGGVAISRILGCRGVAVLPAGMSRERFDWLRAMGGRSGRHHPHAGHREQRQGNLRQVRGACARPDNVILNQFSEFANYLDPLSLHRARRSTASSRI